MSSGGLVWTDFFPDTPEEVHVLYPLSLPVPIVAAGLLQYCDLQSCIQFVRISSRAYSSFVLQLKINERATLRRQQRAAIILLLQQRAEEAWLRSWVSAPVYRRPATRPRTVPPPPQAIEWLPPGEDLN